MSRGFAFIDTETTGTHRDARVIELAVVTFSPAGRRTGDYSTLLRGDGTVGGPTAQRVHGIAPADIKNAPTFGTVWPDVAEIVTGHVLIAHNAAFDRGRINYELGLMRTPLLPAFSCTMRLAYDLGYARRKRGNVPGTSARLGDLVARLDLDVRPTHRALADAEAAASLFWYFRKHHRADVERLLQAAVPLDALRGESSQPLSRKPTTTDTTNSSSPARVRTAVEKTRRSITSALKILRAADAPTLADLSAATAAALGKYEALRVRFECGCAELRRPNEAERAASDLFHRRTEIEVELRGASAGLTGLRRVFSTAAHRADLERRRSAASHRLDAIQQRIDDETSRGHAARKAKERSVSRLPMRINEAQKAFERSREQETAVAACIRDVRGRGFKAPGPDDDLFEWAAAIRAELSRLLKVAEDKDRNSTDRRRLDRLVRTTA